MKKKNYFWTVVIAAVICVWFVNLVREREEIQPLERIYATPEAAEAARLCELYADRVDEIQDSCELLNKTFEVDSFKVVKEVIFSFPNDKTILYEVLFKEGGSCKGISCPENEPQKRIAVGDSVRYRKYHVPSFYYSTGKGGVGVFEAVSCWDEEYQGYYYL